MLKKLVENYIGKVPYPVRCNPFNGAALAHHCFHSFEPLLKILKLCSGFPFRFIFNIVARYSFRYVSFFL